MIVSYDHGFESGPYSAHLLSCTWASLEQFQWEHVTAMERRTSIHPLQANQELRDDVVLELEVFSVSWGGLGHDRSPGFS
jgi:hypothetical protein